MTLDICFPQPLCLCLYTGHILFAFIRNQSGAKPSRTAENNSAYLGMVGVREFKIVFMPQNKISFI